MFACIFVASMVGKVDLAKYVPTPEELQQARDILAGIDRGSKEAKSKMASMVLFVKAQGGDNTDEILSSRGAARNAYLEKYISYMNKKKGSAKTVVTTLKHEQVNSSITEYHRWSKHQMETNVGATKAKGWIDSGKLSWRRDRFRKGEKVKILNLFFWDYGRGSIEGGGAMP